MMANLDQVLLVDRHDQPQGEMDKIAAHRCPGHRHRAISVFLVDGRRRLLLQQRSQQKLTMPGAWGNTVCANVRPTETVLDCAQRRLREELGVTTPLELTELGSFAYQVKLNADFWEKEIDHLIIGKIPAALKAEIKPNPAEVQRVAGVNLNLFFNEIRQRNEQLPLIQAGELSQQLVLPAWLINSSSEKKANRSAEKLIGQLEMTIVPWLSLIMFSDWGAKIVAKLNH